MKQIRVDIDKHNWEKELDRTKECVLFRGNKLIGRLIPEKSFNPRNVKDIIDSDTRYFVPAYQRGYRWEEQQVLELLDDIWNWSLEDNDNTKKKYCLQPIVISESDNQKYDFNLVDGQQRLTSIYIIIKAIKDEIKKDAKYSIDYETRPDSSEYLDSLDESRSHKNIDYYYMYNAFKVAKEYFKSDNKRPDIWFERLIDEKSGAFFIEYNVLQEIDDRSCEQIFTGLNAGKIPLTNSELVKALILRKRNFNENTYYNEFIEIAQEWDRIEKRLRDSNFWAWLGNKEVDEPHIDFVLDIVAEDLNKDNNLEIPENIQSYSYNVFYRFLEFENSSVYDLWKKIKTCFMTFEDWYDDVETYHLVGFLNQEKTKGKSMAKYYNKFKSRDDFCFRSEIKKRIESIDLRELNYEDRSAYEILLLFNIVTCIKNKIKFHFDLFRDTRYDVEHIFPRSELDNLKTEKERKEWIKSIKDSKLFTKLNINLEGKTYSIAKLEEKGEYICSDEMAFKNIYEQIINNGITDDESKIDNPDGIGNLCLLDRTTNRGYGNKPFPNKVKEITEIDAKQERYILPCTKNVFLKYYSGLNINNYVWTKCDAKNYEDNIVKEISKFFDLVGDYIGE